jgi:electron transfer flavoprotein alpha subunit
MAVENNKRKYESVWAVAEQTEGKLHEATLEIFEEGRRIADRLGVSLSGVLLGYNVAALADGLSSCGADQIYLAEHPLLSEYSTDFYTAALANLVSQYVPSLVLMNGTPNGRDMAPRIATRLRVGFVSNCVRLRINSSGVLEAIKPVYNNKYYATIPLPAGKPHLVSIVPGSIGKGERERSREAPVVRVNPGIGEVVALTKVISTTKIAPAALDIREAEVVVAGGRGVGGKTEWRVVESLAEALGACIGGSRAALDMDCIKRENLVGQAGKVISPKLYFTLGISGATQHIAGIKDAEYVIAVNKDRLAPIFRYSNIAIVADLHQLVPAITKRLAAPLKSSFSEVDGEII